MLLTIVVCAAATFCGSDAAVQSQHVAPPQAAASSAKKLDPKAIVANPPQTDAAKTQQKTQPKPEQKSEKKPELLAIEQSIVDYTNAERARYGLPAFVVDPNLMATARKHCTWMTTYRQLVHTNMAVAENIAMGQPNSQDVVRCWMNSSGHRANILNGGHRHIGVAAFRTPEGTIFWCQQFTP